MKLLNKSGGALVSTMVGGVIGVIALASLGRTIVSASQTGMKMQRNLVADAYASELLEFFLSQSPTELKAYISKNPINQGAAPYPLCSPINKPEIDENNNLVINRDPVADLPGDALSNGNRFYRFEVVDISNPNNLTMSRRELCGRNPNDLTLSSNERFLVTVGVDWQDSQKKAQQVVLSGIVSGAPTTRFSTNTVGVAFEDAVDNSGDLSIGMLPWDFRDIKACVQGNFEVDPVTHRIFSKSATPQTLNITSQARPGISCRHQFYITVYDANGNFKFESQGYSPNYSVESGNTATTTITVTQGDEIVLSWRWISDNICRFNGRDPSTRLTENRPQTSGPVQKIPPPSFHYGWCGDYDPGPNPYGCQGIYSYSSRSVIKSHMNDPVTILNNGEWMGADQVTREKVCSLNGRPKVRGYTTETNPGSMTVSWNPSTHTYDKVSASTNNTILKTIQCECP